MSTHYFAADGSYGLGDLVVIDTSHWTVSQWACIDKCHDAIRIDAALGLSGDVLFANYQPKLPGI